MRFSELVEIMSSNGVVNLANIARELEVTRKATAALKKRGFGGAEKKQGKNKTNKAKNAGKKQAHNKQKKEKKEKSRD